MKIYVNNEELEVSGQRVLIEELREAGYDIPSMRNKFSVKIALFFQSFHSFTESFACKVKRHCNFSFKVF